MNFEFPAHANPRVLIGAAVAVVAICGGVVAHAALNRPDPQPVRIQLASAAPASAPIAKPTVAAKPLKVERVSFSAVRPAPAFDGRTASQRDLECLTTAVYYEARGESAAGQAAVAQVVLNRVRAPGFPKSVCAVVYQGAGGRGCQFSFACDNIVDRGLAGAAWTRARSIATRALAGFVMQEVGNATHFHASRVSPGWGSGLRQVAQIGLHVFYRPSRGGTYAAQPYRRREPSERIELASLTTPPPATAVEAALSASDVPSVDADQAVAAPTPSKPADAGQTASPAVATSGAGLGATS